MIGSYELQDLSGLVAHMQAGYVQDWFAEGSSMCGPQTGVHEHHSFF